MSKRHMHECSWQPSSLKTTLMPVNSKTDQLWTIRTMGHCITKGGGGRRRGEEEIHTHNSMACPKSCCKGGIQAQVW